jgi:FAD/FMN-containing dehydrogenase
MALTPRSDYRSWGGTVAARHFVVQPRHPDEVAQLLERRTGTALAFGCGRSYGDVALNPDGLLLDCRKLDRFVAFDPATGVLTCEAGARLADILDVICQPDPEGGGWFLPVSPGTRFVTLGGAIANDVHGKNHHQRGTFGRHVLAFDLARSDGSVLPCSARENMEMFAATIGGLGLTGVILRATIQLRRVEGLAVEAEDLRFGSLQEFLDLSKASEEEWEYTAAWIDCFHARETTARGVFSRARHVVGAGPAPRLEPRFRWPAELPVSLVTRHTAKAFNALYWHWPRSTEGERRITSYDKVLYPLDGIDCWNRLYGPKGFFQFQCAVPWKDAQASVTEMLRLISCSGEGSSLAVLKGFSAIPSPGLLSFPLPGLTLALDFPNRGASTLSLLKQLEEIVRRASGRLYPAKDCVMERKTFLRGYPRLNEFLPLVDPGFSSAFARRVGIVGEGSGQT